MRELLAREAAVLKKAGFDADEIHAILQGSYDKAAETNARQEDTKRQLKERTKDVVRDTDALDTMASGYLDAAMVPGGKGISGRSAPAHLVGDFRGQLV